MEKIRKLAYSKWEKAGRPLGDDTRFWFEAEKELLAKKDCIESCKAESEYWRRAIIAGVFILICLILKWLTEER